MLIRSLRSLLCATGAPLLLAAAASAQPAPPQAPAPQAPAPQAPAPASASSSKCDAQCVRANMERASQACARPIEAQAPIDFEWLTRPHVGIFQEADQSDEKTAVVAYRGDSIRFMNPQKDWVRVTYECAFDAESQKMVGVRVRPGRLNQSPPAVAASRNAPAVARNAAGAPAVARNAPAGSPQQIKSEPLAAAIVEAVKNRQQQQQPLAAPRPKTIKVGEPTAIDIEQVDPSRIR